MFNPTQKSRACIPQTRHESSLRTPSSCSYTSRSSFGSSYSQGSCNSEVVRQHLLHPMTHNELREELAQSNTESSRAWLDAFDMLDDIVLRDAKEFLSDIERRTKGKIHQLLHKISDAKNRKTSLETFEQHLLSTLESITKTIYETVDPRDHYTKLTDKTHGQDVKNMVLWLSHRRGQKSDITILIAALFHDMERYLPEFKVKSYSPQGDLTPTTHKKLKNLIDEQGRKKIAHPCNSAILAYQFLKHAPISSDQLKEILTLIQFHDAPEGVSLGRRELGLGDDFEGHSAEHLTIFRSLDVSSPMYEKVKLLSAADSLAFFSYTIGEFVEDRLRKNPDDMDKIADRICMLYTRCETRYQWTIDEIMDKWRNHESVWKAFNLSMDKYMLNKEVLDASPSSLLKSKSTKLNL